MATEQACANFTQGDPRVVVAYVEGGINWAQAAGIVNHIYVNWKELPIPCVGSTVTTAVMPTLGGIPCAPAWSDNPQFYAIPSADGSDVQMAPDGQPVVNASDWTHDPRLSDRHEPQRLHRPRGPHRPLQLFQSRATRQRSLGHQGCPPRLAIVGPTGHRHAVVAWQRALLHEQRAGGVDRRLGLPRTTSRGGSFYDNSNDSASPGAAYPHSDDEMGQVASYCPYCMIMPVKAGDEALDAADQLAEAWLFAGQTGASVITLGHRRPRILRKFMSEVVRCA